MVVDVLFKLVILEFIVNTDKPDVFTSPTTFNVDKHVVELFSVVAPDTFNEEFKLEFPLTFNDELIEVLLNFDVKMFVPLAFKYIPSFPLVEILTPIFGIEGLNAGAIDLQ